MSKSKKSTNKKLQALFWFLLLAAAIFLIVRHITVFSNVLLVLIGFGAVVIVHEFGHFIIAKMSDIKVEAFSIFMPPTLLGVRKTKDGFKLRILPGLFAKESEEPEESPISTTDSAEDKTNNADQTEYRIGLIPFGGFVKMLGQDDSGPVKSSDDPRSFSNKPVTTRVAVIAAGVTFNVISAVIIFMIVFLAGIKLPPPVVGDVIPNSPAAQAGLKPGDEIVEIAGKSKDLDFSNILIAAALSGQNEKVPLRVKHKDGSEEYCELIAEPLPGKQMKDFGINMPLDLTIEQVTDANALLKKTGLLPGDRIKAVNGRDVQSYWELEEIIQKTLVPQATLLVERKNKDVKTQLIESKIGLEIVPVGTGQIYSMVPRFRMEEITVIKSAWEKTADKMRLLLEKIGIIEQSQKKPFLQSGDIILSIDDVKCPSSEELNATVREDEDNELPITVLRTDPNGNEKQQTINIRLKRDPKTNEARIGITYIRTFDFEHPVVAQTVAVEGGPPKLEIPRGAVITTVDDEKVSSFYDIIRQIRRHSGEQTRINYLDGKTPGSVTLNLTGDTTPESFRVVFAEYIPFKPLEITYRASGPVNAITMGYRRTIMFIAQTYVTIKRLIGGVVSPKNLMGPVGIITVSYRIVADQPLVDYIYLLGLISAAIAVFNLLPLPPLDGGLIALLLIEKIKGSALSERTQGIIAYTGWVLIGTLILYVTFNDVVRNFLS
jgi:regulator of sigma E protease